MVYERGRTPRRSLSSSDRLLWCFLARFWSSWREALDIVQPATVTRWQHARWWRHLLRRRTRRPGRPRIDSELQALIRQIARENRRWGSMRILGELRSLGFEVSNSTVRRYRGTTADPSRQHWTTFHRNHGPYLAEALREAAIDGFRLAHADRFTAATAEPRARHQAEDGLSSSRRSRRRWPLAATASAVARERGIAGACKGRPGGSAEGRLRRMEYWHPTTSTIGLPDVGRSFGAPQARCR